MTTYLPFDSNLINCCLLSLKSVLFHDCRKLNDPNVRLMERETTFNEICNPLSRGPGLWSASTDSRTKYLLFFEKYFKESLKDFHWWFLLLTQALAFFFFFFWTLCLIICKQFSLHSWACSSYGNGSELPFILLENKSQSVTQCPSNLEKCSKWPRL